MSHTYITAWWVSLITGIIAALIAMEMARKAEHEKLMDAATAEGIGTLSATTQLRWLFKVKLHNPKCSRPASCTH